MDPGTALSCPRRSATRRSTRSGTIFDVAVWRPSSERRPRLAEPVGLGRPGWHAECARWREHARRAGRRRGRRQDLAFPHHRTRPR